MELSGDEGIEETTGSYEETLNIKSLSDIKILYILALNFTDAQQNKQSSPQRRA